VSCPALSSSNSSPSVLMKTCTVSIFVWKNLSIFKTKSITLSWDSFKNIEIPNQTSMI
jgi:hypothetical protein